MVNSNAGQDPRVAIRYVQCRSNATLLSFANSSLAGGIAWMSDQQLSASCHDLAAMIGTAEILANDRRSFAREVHRSTQSSQSAGREGEGCRLAGRDGGGSAGACQRDDGEVLARAAQLHALRAVSGIVNNRHTSRSSPACRRLEGHG